MFNILMCLGQSPRCSKASSAPGKGILCRPHELVVELRGAMCGQNAGLQGTGMGLQLCQQVAQGTACKPAQPEPSQGSSLHPHADALQMGARKEDRRFSLPVRRVQRRPMGEAALRDRRWLSVFARAVSPGRQVRAAFWVPQRTLVAKPEQCGALELSGAWGMRLLALH